MPTIHAAFADAERAQSAVGRLEVAGVPSESISVSDDPLAPPKHANSETVVTAEVTSEHYDKALAILSAEGRVSG